MLLRRPTGLWPLPPQAPIPSRPHSLRRRPPALGSAGSSPSQNRAACDPRTAPHNSIDSDRERLFTQNHHDARVSPTDRENQIAPPPRRTRGEPRSPTPPAPVRGRIQSPARLGRAAHRSDSRWRACHTGRATAACAGGSSRGVPPAREDAGRTACGANLRRRRARPGRRRRACLVAPLRTVLRRCRFVSPLAPRPEFVTKPGFWSAGGPQRSAAPQPPAGKDLEWASDPDGSGGASRAWHCGRRRIVGESRPLIPCTIAGPEAPRQQATRGGRAGWEASRGSDSEESSCCGQQGRGGRPPLPLTQSNRPIQTQTARPPRRSAVSDDEGGSAGLNSLIQAPPNHDPADSFHAVPRGGWLPWAVGLHGPPELPVSTMRRLAAPRGSGSRPTDGGDDTEPQRLRTRSGRARAQNPHFSGAG